MERYRQQLKKGVLEMVVLATVAQSPSYGYRLLGDMDARSGGLFRMKEGSLYPVLYRLEDDGMIEARWQPGEGRATPKKYYAATAKGAAQLGEMKNLWAEFSACVDGMLARAAGGGSQAEKEAMA